jgi:hypothetical protein
MKADTRKIAKAFIHDRQKQRGLNNLMKRFAVSLFFREKSLPPTTTSKPSYTTKTIPDTQPTLFQNEGAKKEEIERGRQRQRHAEGERNSKIRPASSW